MHERTDVEPGEVLRQQVLCPPPCGCLKLNVDAAFRDRDKIGCLGIVARDSHSAGCFCAVAKLDCVADPLYIQR